MMMQDRRWMTSFVIVMTFSIMVGATSFRSLEDTIEDENESFENSICLVMLKKPIAGLLVSEYNRITTTNQWLYIISRDPHVTCKDNDYTDCIMYIEVTASTCLRGTSSTNCPPANENHKKTCIATIDLIEATPREKLKCLPDNDEVSPAEMSPLTAMKILKKQWGFKGGNAYPI